MTKTEIVTHLIAGVDRETYLAMSQDNSQQNRNRAKQTPKRKALALDEYIVKEYSLLADEIIKQTAPQKYVSKVPRPDTTGTKPKEIAVTWPVLDKNGIRLKQGDSIDIEQTVNGQNLFYIARLNPLKILYDNYRRIEYEYDQLELIDQDERGLKQDPTFRII